MKTRLGKSKIHGRGIFATKKIRKNELIERCPILPLTKAEIRLLEKTCLVNYYFEWGKDGGAIALGYGSLYNHSYLPNGRYEYSLDEQHLEFFAEETIQQGEEILVNYNGDVWNQDPVWFDK